jgi:hypothetical protein
MTIFVAPVIAATQTANGKKINSSEAPRIFFLRSLKGAQRARRAEPQHGNKI